METSNEVNEEGGEVVKISEFKRKRSVLAKACDGIYRISKSFGYSKAECKVLCKAKKSIFKGSKDYEAKLLIRENIHIGLLLPVGLSFSVEEWFANPKAEREEALWAAGVDVKGSHYMEDVLCTTLGTRQYCGFCVYGQERTDDEWVTQKDEAGKLVSSMEAQLANKDDPEYTKDIRELGGTE